jgi:hypothetical protein
VVRRIALTLGILSTLGLAATPQSSFSVTNVGSEATWTLVTGGLLFLLATAARRMPVRKEQ